MDSNTAAIEGSHTHLPTCAMPERFNLNLCEYRLYVWLGSVGMLAALLVAALLASQVFGRFLQLAVMVIVSGVGFYGVYQLLKKVTIHASQLTLDATGLTVHYLASGKTRRITFEEVVSYRDEWLRDGRELRFRLHSGEKVRLATNDFLAPSEGYGPFLQAMQRAIAQRSSNDPLPIAREKSFYEKPFATMLLVLTGALILLAAGQQLLGHKPFQGSFLVAVATWGVYFTMWRIARTNRC